MPVLEEGSSSSSTIAEHIKGRRPRNQIIEADPTSEIPSLIQSTRCKTTISSLFLSTFSTSNNGGNETVPTNTNVTPKKKTTQSTFRALGCTASASQQVSVPAVIRTSADWDAKKVKKKTQKQEKRKKKSNDSSTNKVVNENSKVPQGFVSDGGNGNGCGVIQDVWCGPGIGFSADTAGSVDCVVARRNVSGRGKIDGERISHRERSCLPRRTVTPEAFSFLDSDSGFVSSHPEPDFFASRYYRHFRHPSPEGLAEIFILQNSLLMGGHDQFSDWRLDIDDMTYEQLLELEDRIGYVNIGLKEDEVSKCLRKTKHSLLKDLPSNVRVHMDGKCSVCQEEYEADDEMGKLYCGHSFHIQCIKQWLTQKKTCPVCKTEVRA